MTDWLTRTINAGRDIVYLQLDEQYRITAIEGASNTIIGQPACTLQGCYFPGLAIPGDHKDIASCLRQARNNSDYVSFDMTIPRQSARTTKWQVLWDAHDGFVVRGLAIGDASPQVTAMLNLADSLPMMLAYVDHNLRYRFTNRAYEKHFHISRADMVGKTVTEVLGEATYLQLKPNYERVLQGETVHLEDSVPMPDGRLRYLSIDYIPDFQGHNKVRGFYAAIQDITEYRSSIRLLKAIHRIVNQPKSAVVETIDELLELGRAFLDMPVGIVAHIDNNHYEVKWTSTELGEVRAGDCFALEETIALKADEILYTSHAGDHKHISCHPSYKHCSMETYIGIPLKIDGQIWGTLEFCSPEPRNKHFPEIDFELLRLIGSAVENLVVEDRYITRLNRERENMATQVYTDSLTGIASRASIEHCFRALSDHYSEHSATAAPISVAIIDLDFFKRINDTCGHQAGDDVLTVVAQALQASLRQGDIIGRIGGEEFIILFYHTDLATALIVMERLRQQIAGLEIDVGKDKPVTLTFSAGITEYQADDNEKTVYSRADKALYAAKYQGRNQICSMPAPQKTRGEKPEQPT